MKIRKFTAFFLTVLLIAVSAVSPFCASADVISVSVSYTDTAVDNSVYSINNVYLTENTVHVSYKASEKCKLTVAFLFADSSSMITSVTKSADKTDSDKTIDIAFDTSLLPEYFDINCFLLSEENSPLCDMFSVSNANIDKDNTNTDDTPILRHEKDNTSIIAYGVCSGNETVLWELHESGSLFIYGEGCDMFNYKPDENYFAPWHDEGLANKVKHAVVEKGVEFVGDYAFFDLNNLQSVHFSQGIMEVGKYACADCSELKDVYLTPTITALGAGVFKNCSMLTRVDLPSGILYIPEELFSSCIRLKAVTISDYAQVIGKEAFSNCQSLSIYFLPDSIIAMGDGAFYSCNNITEITFPESLRITGNNTFKNCSRLKNVTVSAATEAIGDDCFGFCGELESVEIPSDGELSSIGENAFRGCYSLFDISFSEHLSSLGSSSFKNCWSLEEIVFPVALTSIPDYCFSECTSLIDVWFGDELTEIGAGSFSGCKSLESVFLPASTIKINKNAFENCSAVDDIYLPDSITLIGDHAFANCTSLESVILPNGLTEIGNAFFGCTALKEVKLSKSLQSINGEAFFGCTSLSCLSIPDGVKYINSSAFSGCTGLRAVQLPASLEKISQYAFFSCDNIDTIYFTGQEADLNEISFGGYNGSLNSADVHCNTDHTFGFKNHYNDSSDKIKEWSCGNDATAALMSNGTLYIYGSGDMYNYTEASSTGTPLWSEYADSISSIVIESGIETIGECAFAKLNNLQSVSLGDTVKKINKRAFFESSLTEIAFPCSLTEIGEEAFAFCKKLDFIDFEYGVQKIDRAAFQLCTSLTILELPDSVTEIGYSAFVGCSSLNKVSLSSNITEVKNGVFQNCRNLKSIVIPKGVTSIGRWAFTQTGLTSIEIPISVTKIYSDAFSEAYSLEDVYYPSKEVYWNNIDFSDGNDCLLNTQKHFEMTIWDSLFGHYSETNSPLYSGKIGWYAEWAIYDSGTLYIYGEAEMPDFIPESKPAPWLEHSDIITNVVIESLITKIGRNAFYGLDNVDNISIGSGVTTLSVSTFENCTSLETVEIPKQITIIPARAFAGCTNLTEITANGVTMIHNNAFTDCSSLVYAGFAPGLNSLGKEVFMNCVKLKTIELPDTLGIVGSDAFLNTPWFDSLNSEYNIIGNGILLKYIPQYQYMDKVLIPNTVKRVSPKAFTDFDGIDALQLPETVTIIDTNAFSINYLNRIYYLGDQTQWDKISVAVNNELFTECPEVYISTRCPKYDESGHALEASALVEIGNCGTSVFWEIHKNGRLYIYGTGEMYNYGLTSETDVPPWYHNYTGFEGKTVSGIDIKEIIIEPGVTSIGAFAFTQCNACRSVTLPDTLTKISEKAFSYSKSISRIDLPDSVAEIGNEAFIGCSSLEYVVMRKAEKIGAYLFKGCSSLLGVELPEELTEIPPYLFADSGLRSYTFSEKIESISYCAFENCDNIQYIKIPLSIKKIGKRAFTNCKSLKVEFTGGDDPLIIENEAFYGSAQPGTIVFSRNMTIGESAFSECAELTGVSFTNGEISILGRAFKNCPMLSDVIFNENAVVSFDGEFPFNKCPMWKKVTIPKTIDPIPSNVFAESSLESINIADGITTISEYAFCSSGISSISIPNSVTQIKEGAFSKCNNLSHIDLPDKLSTISEECFSKCSSLKNITLPESVTTIEDFAFYCCSKLYNIALPSKLEQIGEFAFSHCGNEEDYLLYNITLPNNLQAIGSNAFSYSGLYRITIPKSLKELKKEAFYSCKFLKYVRFEPGSRIDSIRSSLFENCTKLKAVEIPVSVNKIYPCAFDGCDSFSEVYYSGTKDQWKSIDISYEYTYTEVYYPPQYYDKDGPEYYDVTDSCNLILKDVRKNYQKYIPDSVYYSASANNINISKGEAQLTISELRPDTQYAVFYVSDKTIELTDRDNLLYIDQLTANENGEITVNDYNYLDAHIVAVGLKPDNTSNSDTDTENTDSTDSESDTENTDSTDTESDTENTDNTDSEESPDKPLKKKGLLGDVNCDGKITAMDSLILQRYTINLTSLNDIQQLLGDVNKDGKLTGSDCMNILRYSINLKTNSYVGEEIEYFVS